MVLVVWDNWGEHVCRQLSNFLIGAALTDVTISVGTKSIKTHRIILSFFSPFFKKMLDDVNEEQPVVVVFPDINFRALQIIIAYMYQGQVNVPAEILQHVTELAKMLKVKGLTKLPTYLNSVITDTEVKIADDEEELEHGIEDHSDFASETEGIVELEVSTADGEPTVSSNMRAINTRTAVTVITNTSPCASPKKAPESPLHTKEDHISVSESSVTSSINIEKNESNNSDHILIQSEDIQLSTVDELTPTHIVKLSEDGSMSEVLFSGDYIHEGASEDHSSSKESASLPEDQKQCSKKRRESLYKVTKYGPDDLVRALEDLKAGMGTLREIAERWGVPRSTLSVSARIAGVSPLQKNLDYDTKSLEEAKQAVRGGSSYMKAAKEFNIPKSVLWRKCQRDGIFRREAQRYYNYGQDDLVRARQMLCSGQSLTDTVKETKIPKTTVFRLKEQLVREGKMPASCISRIFRPRKPSEGSLQQAVVACTEEGMSLSQASEKLQVAKTTVWRRLKRLKEQDSVNSSLGESEVYRIGKKHIKVEASDQLDVSYSGDISVKYNDEGDLRYVERKSLNYTPVSTSYNCYGSTEKTVHKRDQLSKRKNIEVNTLESAMDSTESQTVIMESESFLASEGTVIHTGSPMTIKQENSLTETDGTTVVTTENSENTHFQLEMPLVNFPGGGYQVVGSEIVIGGQHMVVLDSSESSQHPHSSTDRHIVVTPFTEMEVTNADESSVQPPGNVSPKANQMEPDQNTFAPVYSPAQETLTVSTSSSQDITECLQSIKSEPNTSNDQQKSVSDDRMTELITEFMSVD